jgi:hypothetical protein
VSETAFGKFVKKHNRVVAYVGTSIVLLTFIAKEGLGESWRKTAEALDTAQYMYSLATFNSSANVKLSQALNQLEAIRHPTSTKSQNASEVVFPPDKRTRTMDEITLLESSISDAMILLERLPELKSMEAQGERLTKALEEIKQEVEFLAERDAAEVMQEVTSGDHKPWTYAPKQNQKHYHLSIRPANVAVTPIETLLDTEDNAAEMLQRDIFDFNKGILDEAKAVRARNEVKAEWAWWISVGLFVIGWFIGLLGTIYGIPTGVEKAA